MLPDNQIPLWVAEGFRPALLAQILATRGARATTELRYQHQDGTWRWVEATVANLLHEPSV